MWISDHFHDSSSLADRPTPQADILRNISATQFSSGRNHNRQECWTLLYAFSAIGLPGNSTVVCRDSCILIFIDWTVDVTERVKYRLGRPMLIYRYASTTKLLGTWSITARQFLTTIRPTANVLPAVMISPHVPRYRLSTYGRRAFSVAGPTVWNSLPEDMRDCGIRSVLWTRAEDILISIFHSILECLAH